MTVTQAPVPHRRDDHTIAADPPLVTRHRWSPRWWPAGLAAVVVVAVAAVGLSQITAPMLSFDGEPAVWRSAPGDLADVQRVENALGTEVTVGFERSGTFNARLALVNHGRYPVKVLGLPERGAHYYGLESVGMASNAEGPTQPFRPFTLRRGATRWLTLHFRFAGCDLATGGGVGGSRASLPISYRVFGLRRREAVPFSRFVLSVPTGRCDRPVL
jgi:hypothetical protein